MLFLFACTPEPVAEAPWYSPEQPGPFAVGTREGTVASRTGISLDVQWWFPASEVETEDYRYDDIWPSPTAREGTPACTQPRPVLVFSHGNTAMRWQSYFLTEYLASHGWVIAAPDHRYNTVFDNDEDLKAEVAVRRPLDLADTYDDLLARNADSADPLFGCIDPAAGYHVAGHSFGGYTSLAIGGAVIDVAASRAECDNNGGWLCDLLPYYEENYGPTAVIDGGDSRVLSIAPMAPAGRALLIGGLGAIQVPTMILGGDLDGAVDWSTEVQPIWRDIDGTDPMLGELLGAGHLSFSNACEILGTFPGCGEETLPDARAQTLVATATTTWLMMQEGDEKAKTMFPPGDPEWIWEQGP